MDEGAGIDEGWLARYEATELLRFVAVGSVDDGKSTLIGRLLYDTGGVHDDQLAAVRRASAGRGMGELDLSLLTDGLAAEREQGITIDVAYRYFATARRKFIIADTPGHVQYTRNMVTGASTADAAVILIDARLGVQKQSRRHAHLASMLGIRHLVVAINKMDLVDWDRQVFARIREAFAADAARLSFYDVTFVPVSALTGDNVVAPSERMPWHEGPTILSHLESVPVAGGDAVGLRFPVQYVLRPNLDYRAFAGQIAAGTVRPGDEVLVLPSGSRTRVRAIDTYEGALDEARRGMSVALRLFDEVDVSRGDMLVRPDDVPRVGRAFDAHLVWMSERPLDLDKSYLLAHTTRTVRAQVTGIAARVDMDTLAQVPAETLGLNDVATVSVRCHRALYHDAYARNRATGAFILIDTLTNDTVAAGMILDDARRQELDEALREVRAGSGLEFKTQVSPGERGERMGQVGATVWLVGLPGSGRWALAYALERRLFDLGRTATVIDPTGETLRSMIAAARACTAAGLVTVCAFPSYARTDRDEIRRRIGDDRVVLAYVDTDPALCRERRPDVPAAAFERFEPPPAPDLTVALDRVSLDDAVEAVIAELERRGQFNE